MNFSTNLVKNPQNNTLGWSEVQYWNDPLFYLGMKELKNFLISLHFYPAFCIVKISEYSEWSFSWIQNIIHKRVWYDFLIESQFDKQAAPKETAVQKVQQQTPKGTYSHICLMISKQIGWDILFFSFEKEWVARFNQN